MLSLDCWGLETKWPSHIMATWHTVRQEYLSALWGLSAGGYMPENIFKAQEEINCMEHFNHHPFPSLQIWQYTTMVRTATISNTLKGLLDTKALNWHLSDSEEITVAQCRHLALKPSHGHLHASCDWVGWFGSDLDDDREFSWILLAPIVSCPYMYISWDCEYHSGWA